jgi:peptidoglycan/xylan/chitin deacetylase (PgdA/CDA1 family)
MTDRPPRKLAFLTLDLEPDHCDLVEGYHYEAFSCIDYLCGLIREKGLALTVFATGTVLETRPEMVLRLAAAGAEIELHGHRHKPPAEGVEEIAAGLRAYKRLFGRAPIGYRAPLGMISMKEIEHLARERFMFDSSFFPSLFPGRFANLRAPTSPFIHKGTTLWELPISVIPIVRIPIALSYIQLLGRVPFHLLAALFGLPRYMVMDFHLHDLFPTRVYHTLPLKWKLIYSRCFLRRRSQGTRDLERLIALCSRRGYSFRNLRFLYDLCAGAAGKGYAP